MRLISRLSRDERGFSMFLVIMAMFAMSMFVAAGYAAANGDLPLSGQSKDRKEAYAAAEAGLNFYLTHLNQDSDYWTYCDNPPDAAPGVPAPVNQPWNGTGSDPRTWRNIPNSKAQYTIELLPIKGSPPTCDPNDQTSMLDMSTGTFKIRATGRATPNGQRRSIVASFRRQGFLDFLYFTDYEDLDPQALSTQTARTTATTNCGGRYRSSRSGCTEIQFITGDSVNGPLHSNDSILICNTPAFGRTTNNRADNIESYQVPGRVAASSCTDSAQVNGTWKQGSAMGVKQMKPPVSNGSLEVIAQNGGYVFYGKTYIYLNGDGTMDVSSMVNGVRTLQTNLAVPGNGVIYVDAYKPSSGGGSCTQQYPTAASYNEEDYCANVYVNGAYDSSLTIAAANDVIVAPVATTGNGLAWGQPYGVTKANNQAVLGLIANNFVRVAHPVNRGSSCTNAYSTYDGGDISIDAAILSIDHSFIVDNYDCGNALGHLDVTGAIAQRYRGAVGTGSGSSRTGFLKNYWYDDRLKYRSPPHFLNPVDSAWSIVRSSEQVPAR
jgi:Tfp pilus assembly protein PilX